MRQINSFSRGSFTSASDANLIGRTSSPNQKKREKDKQIFTLTVVFRERKKTRQKNKHNFSRGKRASSGAASGKRHLRFKAAARVSHFGLIG